MIGFVILNVYIIYSFDLVSSTINSINLNSKLQYVNNLTEEIDLASSVTKLKNLTTDLQTKLEDVRNLTEIIKLNRTSRNVNYYGQYDDEDDYDDDYEDESGTDLILASRNVESEDNNVEDTELDEEELGTDFGGIVGDYEEIQTPDAEEYDDSLGSQTLDSRKSWASSKVNWKKWMDEKRKEANRKKPSSSDRKKFISWHDKGYKRERPKPGEKVDKYNDRYHDPTFEKPANQGRGQSQRQDGRYRGHDREWYDRNRGYYEGSYGGQGYNRNDRQYYDRGGGRYDRGRGYDHRGHGRYDRDRVYNDRGGGDYDNRYDNRGYDRGQSQRYNQDRGYDEPPVPATPEPSDPYSKEYRSHSQPGYGPYTQPGYGSANTEREQGLLPWWWDLKEVTHWRKQEMNSRKEYDDFILKKGYDKQGWVTDDFHHYKNHVPHGDNEFPWWWRVGPWQVWKQNNNINSLPDFHNYHERADHKLFHHKR